MESKIDYHVLSMDEIVFDNRNKAYGAFVVRQVYEKNLLKAILISIGFFGLSMSSPAILRGLGLMTENQEAMIEQKIFTLDEFPGIEIPRQKVEMQLPPKGPAPRAETMIPVERAKLPAEENKPETKDPEVNTSPNGSSTPTGATITTTGGTGTQSSGGNDGAKSRAPYGIVEQMPEFIGGEKAFNAFIEDNLPYPIPEKEDEIEGVVKVQFIVNEDGSIEDVKVAQTSGYKNFDAAALKLVKSMPKYKPGRQNGHAVRVLCILPIGFELR